MPLQFSNKYRTHTCGELRESDAGETVMLSGWVDTYRDMGGVIFIDLRDREGVTQVVFDPNRCGKELHDKSAVLRSEYNIRVSGTVAKRLEGKINTRLPTGAVEVEAKDLEVLSIAKPPPIQIVDDLDTSEDVRLKYRYLDMRRPVMQRNLRVRHQAITAIREFMNSQGFWEVETPILGKSTPEGARDYLVPSRINKGMFYALPQSPQIYKQLLMVSGFDKYYQIARCMRDEDLRADRQPEFTQLDFEMSYATQDDVLRTAEGAMKAMFKGGLGVDIQTPFLRLSHAECLRRFGCDKPDMRYGHELVDLTEFSKNVEFKVFKSTAESGGLIKAFNAKGWGVKKPRAQLDKLTDVLKSNFKVGGLPYFKVEKGELTGNLTKFFTPEQMAEIRRSCNAEEGDLILFGVGKPSAANAAASFLRTEYAREEGLTKRTFPAKSEDFKFLWVIDFPLFQWDPEEKCWAAEHHPFTSPSEKDLAVIIDAAKNPQTYQTPDSPLGGCKAVCYDMVLNGVETASGSVRIHNGEVQESIFKLLNLSDEDIRKKFGFFNDALKYGTPPHAGMAPGIDRLVAMMLGYDSIREVIVFPKNQSGRDEMSGAPGEVSERQLNDLAIRLVESDTPKK